MKINDKMLSKILSKFMLMGCHECFGFSPKKLYSKQLKSYIQNK